MNRKINISQDEKFRILGLYGESIKKGDVVIVEMLSPDEKYCIFLDELYDIENKTKIGNIWENFDNFKFFVSHSFQVAENISNEVRETLMESLNSFVITESNRDMSQHKSEFKEIINEGLGGDFVDWLKDTGTSAVQGVSDFVKTSWDGIKKTYSYIKDGEWKKAFQIIGKGILYVARKIRSALYHPIGILLDAILIATGIGKGAQFVIWAIVVALDIYELMTGNYEDPSLSIVWRLLFFGVDILGLVLAGAAAKAGRSGLSVLISRFGKTSEGFASAMKTNKTMQSLSTKILGIVDRAGGLMSKASTYLQKNAPKIYGFLKSTFGAVSKFIAKLKKLLGGAVNTLGKPGRAVNQALGGGKAGKAGEAILNTTVPLAGIGLYHQGEIRKSEENFTSTITKSKAEFDGM
jgi:hypothetical protein